MTSKERVQKAMNLQEPDRVPVMCQLAVGHYFLHSGINRMDIWFTPQGFADALVALQKRYKFDGILINLPGRPAYYQDQIKKTETGDGEDIIRWMKCNYGMVLC